MKKKIIVATILLIVCIVFSNVLVYGFGIGNIKPTAPTGTQADKVIKVIEVILGIIQIVGTILSVVMLMAIGIKYMMGSVEEKAEYKKTLKPYIIGAFIVFTGTLIPNIIYKFVSNL